ncbi:polysaccharide deacetylase family protein [bacterium]|nr:MAG: polysaccharide deacetylase family protein [bacterium]
MTGTDEEEANAPAVASTARPARLSDGLQTDTPRADGLTLREGRNPAVEDRADLYWSKAYREVYRSADELAAQDARERRNGEALPKLIRGNPTRREIALTFDDGPHPAFTGRLLDLLKAEGIPATFFVVGKKAELAPDLIRRMAAEGHEVGNHKEKGVSRRNML